LQYSELLAILEKTRMSPEDLAPILGVSNMTVRRWREEKPAKEVPKAYERLLTDGVQQMLRDGLIAPDSAWAQELLASSSVFSFAAALRGLGVSEKDLAKTGSHQVRLIDFLRFVGFSAEHRAKVDQKETQIGNFKKVDGDWKRHITILLKVIKSKKIQQVDKLIAYGALFYLLCPLDLIPDNIPVFGYMDDFALLALAATYYVNQKLKTPFEDVHGA
jgi:uncharacterized membrane protein YkvA (DUF1232 family)